MNAFEAFLIGLIQGLAEFFPVSSSGHLKLAQYFLGLKDLEGLIVFDLICHLGTLFSIFFIFRRDIIAVVKSWSQASRIAIALLPLFPLLAVIKPIKGVFAQPAYWGFFFLITSLFLFLAERFTSPKGSKNSYVQAFLVGCAQACAVFPGISRSGATISAAQILGWEKVDAARFSFLLAIPTILGGSAYELGKAFLGETVFQAVSLEAYTIGFLSSFLSGLFALVVLMKLVKLGKLAPFKWYCFFLGLASLIYFNLF